MKRLGLVVAIAFLIGCSSLPVIPPVDVPIDIPTVVNDTNTIVITVDKAPVVSEVSWKERCVKASERLNTKETFVGLGFLGIAVALVLVLISFKKRSDRNYR